MSKSKNPANCSCPCWANPDIQQTSDTFLLSKPTHLANFRYPFVEQTQTSIKPLKNALLPNKPEIQQTSHQIHSHWATRHAAVLRCLALVETIDTKQISDTQQISGTLLIQETQTPRKPQTPCWVRKPQTPRKPQTTTCWVDADTQPLLHTIWENQTRLFSANPPNKTWTPSCWADAEETQTPSKPLPPLAEQTQTPNKSRMPFEEQTRQLANPRETSHWPCLGDQQTPSTGLQHPSTTAVCSYATGSRKLSANKQFFVGAQTEVCLLQTTQIISDVCFITDHVAYTNSNLVRVHQNHLNRDGTLFFTRGGCASRLHACLGTRLLLQSY